MNYNDKPRNSCVPLEEIVPGVNMAITINPKSVCNSTNPFAWITTQYNVLRVISGGCEMDLFVESAPSTAKLHFHGFIRVLDRLIFMQTIRLLADYGTFCIKHLFHAEEAEGCKWTDYCLKQSAIWAPAFKDHDGLYGYPILISASGCLPSAPKSVVAHKKIYDA